MLNRAALLAAIATIGLATASNGADAAQSTAKKPSFASATKSRGACGVWICTWRTSDGGCLVWEKSKCKIINPFD